MRKKNAFKSGVSATRVYSSLQNALRAINHYWPSIKTGRRKDNGEDDDRVRYVVIRGANGFIPKIICSSSLECGRAYKLNFMYMMKAVPKKANPQPELPLVQKEVKSVIVEQIKGPFYVIRDEGWYCNHLGEKRADQWQTATTFTKQACEEWVRKHILNRPKVEIIRIDPFDVIGYDETQQIRDAAFEQEKALLNQKYKTTA